MLYNPPYLSSKEPLLKEKGLAYFSKCNRTSFVVPIFGKNHQQIYLVSPNKIVRKQATIKQAVFNQFKFLF